MVKQSLIKDWLVLFPRRFLRGLIRVYQLSFSLLIGRHCRYWPSCSDYTSEAIGRHGAWAGGWIGLARICRCRPKGGEGIDLVPDSLPRTASWDRPWRYGLWTGTNPGPVRTCDAVEPGSAAPR